MASPDILDFDRLLALIPGPDPTGPDLRRDPSPTSDYTQLKDAHRLARNLERERDAATTTLDPASLLPEWRPLLDLAQRVLAEKSKDMEVAAWLIEVLGRVHGFAGLRDGFRLASGLIEQFWDGLHSVEDDDGAPDLGAPLAALNGVGSEGPLPTVIRRIPITDAKGVGPFVLWQYQQAIRATVSHDETVRTQIQAEKQALLERMVQSAKESGIAYYRILIEDIKACQKRFIELQAALDVRCGSVGAPPGGNIRDTLAMALDAVHNLMAELPPEQTSEPPPLDGKHELVVPPGLGSSREEAFRTLLAVAEFFRRHEPHSPISYTLEELVRRGRMSLPELLEELIPDESARRTYLQAAGIKLPPAAN
jgi:type VI secretion system protein ImpA